MSRYVLTPTAWRDLESIWQRIGRNSVANADRVEEAILATCRLAAAMPEAGHTRVDVSSSHILFLSVTSYRRYLIAYELGTDPLSIVRVIHGARNVPQLLSRYKN